MTTPHTSRVIAIGSDHAGYDLKQHLIDYLTKAGHQVVDHGTHSSESVDYPPICAAVARDVRDGKAEIGIVMGGSGQGEQIAANKVLEYVLRCATTCIWQKWRARTMMQMCSAWAAEWSPLNKQNRLSKSFYTHRLKVVDMSAGLLSWPTSNNKKERANALAI